ncbi:DUF6422 family protein [Streptomyces sp. NPDC127117]|uniref:DUF6422 family protein n=1 Tax=Streptomyces sp. NPDC127117 TaxID=3345368 RepID=UPI00363B820E
MSTLPHPDELTDEQSETLEKAAFLVISARKEAQAMLRRSGLEWDEGPFGSRCRQCPCREYEGEGGRCERGSCRHSAAQHAT